MFGLIGRAFTGAARGRASRQLGDALGAYESLDPTVQAERVGPSAYNDINLDPAGRDAQLAAMRQLAGIGAAGGMDEGSRAALQQAQMRNAQEATSRNKAALEQAQAQGRLNSGRALMATMSNNQAAANANAMAGAQAVGDARMRAMQAMAQSGQLGGAIRGQDYQQASDRAQATDLINRFNATQGQQANLATMQGRFERAGGIARGNQALANMNLGQEQQIIDGTKELGSAIGRGLTAGFGGL